jgi:hypothetical protein
LTGGPSSDIKIEKGPLNWQVVVSSGLTVFTKESCKLEKSKAKIKTLSK